MSWRLRGARFLAGATVFFFAVAAYIVLIGDFRIRLPLLTISGTAPTHHLLLALLLSVVARYLGPLPFESQPLPALFLRWRRLERRRRVGVLAAVLAPICLLAGGLAYQGYYIQQGDELMARGAAAESAELYGRAAKWPLGEQEYAKAYRSCMLFGSGQFNQCVDENLSEFQAGVSMRSTRYRCLWSCLGELERYEEALQVVETALDAQEKMVKYAPAAEYFRRMIQTNQGASGRRIPVHFNWDAAGEAEYRVRGSWTAAGRQSDVDGWHSVHPMVKNGDQATLTVPLGLSGRLPLAAVIEEQVGETFRPVAMTHFWNSGEEKEVRTVARAIVEAEPSPRPVWERKPGDGRPRTLVIWPDGGSWFFINTLIQRGGLPNIARYLETAARGTMISTHPPLTATAYLKMVRVGEANQKQASSRGFWAMLALQLKGIPFLDWAFDDEVGSLVDDPNTIFNILRDKGHSAVNLVFSDKYMSAPDDAGKSSAGANQNVDAADLETADILRELGIDSKKEPARAEQIDESMAFIEAYNNTAAKQLIGTRVWKKGEHDFVLLRFPAVDLMSHKFAADAFDDARGNLMLETYRQLDKAFGVFMDEVDADDTLILVSDHGVESALSHHPDCVLAVSGPNVQAGARLPKVTIGQFPHLVLSRFGIQTGALNAELEKALASGLPQAKEAN